MVDMLQVEYRNQQDWIALNAGYWCFLRTALCFDNAQPLSCFYT